MVLPMPWPVVQTIEGELGGLVEDNPFPEGLRGVALVIPVAKVWSMGGRREGKGRDEYRPRQRASSGTVRVGRRNVHGRSVVFRSHLGRASYFALEQPQCSRSTLFSALVSTA